MLSVNTEMAYSKAEPWRINVINFLKLHYELILDILSSVMQDGNRTGLTGNKTKDIIRRNANFSVVRPTKNLIQ